MNRIMNYPQVESFWINFFFFSPEIMKASLRTGLMNSASMLGIHCSESLPQSPLIPRKWNFTGSFCYKFLDIFWRNQTYKKSSAGLSLSIETNPKHIIFKNFPVEISHKHLQNYTTFITKITHINYSFNLLFISYNYFI